MSDVAVLDGVAPTGEPSGDVVQYDVVEGVAVITLNRPRALNAWTMEMGREYLRRIDQASADPEVRVVIVTGAGRGFCSGADMSLLRDLMAGQPPPPESVRPDDETEPAVPKLVIAAINGPCVGLGLVRALYCDVRFITKGTSLSTTFTRRGLVAEHGVAWLLPRIVGASRALDLMMSGRAVGAEEAKAIGLVDHVVDDALVGAMAYARDIVRNCSPAAMRDVKRQIWGDTTKSLRESIDKAAALMLASLTRPDVAVGVVAYLEKREPSFPPLV
ncbi:MAG TPA: enoyl-CoA hydratase-related protein [Mycobacteriales bacterium]|jgi:enoyl-CoA hydratase/carnithine racemase|nr:enoyl-CoA hydratase-related protein [Mycobacteriales bacterium]